MAKFCGTCGSPLNDGQKFCGKCGTGNSVNQQSASSPVQALNIPSASPGSSPPLEVAAPAPARSNTLLKVVVALVLIVLVGGAAALGAVYYAVHKVKEKAQALSKHELGDNAASPESGLASLLQKAASSAKTDAANGGDGDFKGDPCRFLSNQDVSRAVGAEIVRTQAQDGGCSYFAKGDPADMVSKHMTAMVTGQAKANGSHPTADQTKLMQQITGAFFKQQEPSDKEQSKQAATGEVLNLSVS